MSWHYQARRRTQHGQHYYEVVAVYGRLLRSGGGMTPMGDTKAELIADLKRMLADVKRYRTIVQREAP